MQNDRIQNTMKKGYKSNVKLIRLLAAVLIVVILCSPGCLTVQAASPDDWYAVSGTFMQADGNQYNSGKLQLLPMDNGCVLFEFDVMKGSESEDKSEDFRLPGTFYVEEDGTGIWEEETEDGAVSLLFVLDGDTVTVTQTGTFPIPVEGTYTWLEEYLQVTEECAGELLEGLATATTSLNSYNRPYHLEMSDMEVDGWFYDMKAIFTETGSLIGEFLIATDLSAVYRIDTEDPILIYGSVDSMMTAVHDVVLEEGEEPATVARAGNSEAETDVGDGLLYSIPLVDAVPSNSTLAVGETTKVVPVTPGNIPATITCKSGNAEVATVDADGVITGIAPGTATISGTLFADGSEKAFSFEINVWDKSIKALDIQTTIPVGESFTMKAQAIGVSDLVSWSVTNTDLAEIDAVTGVFKGKKEGSLFLVAQAGDLKREWAVTIGPISASGANGEGSVPAAADVGEAGPSGFVLVSIVIALLVIGVVAFVLIKRKKNPTP